MLEPAWRERQAVATLRLQGTAEKAEERSALVDPRARHQSGSHELDISLGGSHELDISLGGSRRALLQTDVELGSDSLTDIHNLFVDQASEHNGLTGPFGHNHGLA